MLLEDLLFFHFDEGFNDDYDLESFPLFEREVEIEKESLKEIKSNNDNFIQEKNIKYNLYPLFINWKKIETEKEKNEYFNVFKLFGYFGVAIFDILRQLNENKEYNHKNFISELNDYKKYLGKSQLEGNEFYKKLIDIYNNVISLIKNRIIIFKEISIFLTVLRLYENYFYRMNDKTKLIEILKCQFLIIFKLTDKEYKKIYDKYFKKFKTHSDESEDENDIWLLERNLFFPKCKKNYINHLKIIYKKKKIEENH